MSILAKFKHFFHPQRSNNHRPEILKSHALLLLAFAFFATLASVHSLIPTVNEFLGSKYNVVLGVTSDITIQQIVDLSNQERQNIGLHELRQNPLLDQAAEDKAADMFAKQYWAHVSADGKQPWDFISDAGYSYTVAGENLARDFQHADQVVEAWMASPTHKANILHEKYTEIGIAVVEGNLEGIETTLVVQMFGNPLDPTLVVDTAPALPAREAILAQETNSTSVAATQVVSISPIAIMKGIFLAVLLIVIVILIYDFMIAKNTNVVRIVGKNMAHVFLLLTVIYLILYYKTGYIV